MPDNPDTHPEEENKPEGIQHDPYEWGKCAVTAQIVWLPDGTVMLGVRSHLDAPILTLLEGDSLARLPGHAAELPVPTAEAIADLLAQLREDLPLRAKAHAEREAASQKKAEESKARVKTGKKGTQAQPAVAAQTNSGTAAPTLARPALTGKAPAPAQASLFNLMTGGQ